VWGTYGEAAVEGLADLDGGDEVGRDDEVCGLFRL